MLGAERDSEREYIDLGSSMASEVDEHSVLVMEKDEMVNKSATPVEEFALLSVGLATPSTERALSSRPSAKKRKISNKTTSSHTLPYIETITNIHGRLPQCSKLSPR